MSIKERILQPVTEVIEKEGFELVELAVLERGHRPVVRVFADRREASDSGGITIDECARLSQKLSDYFDLENVFERSYILEVSSPGLDRLLTTRRDFERKIGRTIRLWVDENGATFEKTGELSGVEETGLRLKMPGGEEFFGFGVIRRGKEAV
jgi:ribosome maturation factor RimP